MSAAFPKPKRTSDKRFLKKVREQPCLVCLELQERQRTPTDPDHITSKGAGGGDDLNNVWPLCRDHHQMRHQIGLPRMVGKFRSLQIFLTIMGRQDVLENKIEPENK